MTHGALYSGSYYLLAVLLQAVFSIWNLLAFTAAPLEQTALTFMPAARHDWQKRSTTQLVVAAGIVLGACCGSIVAVAALLQPQLFTKDVAVWPFMSAVAPQGFLAMCLTGIDVSCTGILLASKDLGYVARSFLVTLGALALYITYGVKAQGWGLAGVWWGLVFFFALRALQSVSRLLWLLNKKELHSGASLDTEPGLH